MKLPIVFSPHYDISLFGLENMHPFDSKKYGKVHKELQKVGLLAEGNWHEPEDKASDELLLQIHTAEYLESLKMSKRVAGIAEMAMLKNLPNFILQWKFLNPMRWATAGTVLGAELAQQFGWAINLSGGYHHAKAFHSSGFCFFADINLAAMRFWESNPGKKVMVIDLDAHQGNGFEDLFADDPRVRTFDVYNGDIYPNDQHAAQFIHWKHPIRSKTGTEAYLVLLNRHLPAAFAEWQPDFVIYNAGTDIYHLDPLGQLGVSADGIVSRDEMVFKLCRQHKAPVLMVLSGGYHENSYLIIANSITQLWKKGLLQPSDSIAL
jgi:histone deacetylase 11